MTTARIATVLDARPILRALVAPDASTPAPLAFRIHPDDVRELRTAYLYCWPGNAPADVFMGVSLVQDAAAERLPRRRL